MRAIAWKNVPWKNEALIILVSAWMTLVANRGFWAVVIHSGPGGSPQDLLHLLSFLSLALGLIALVMLLFATGRATRPVLALLLPVAAAAGYFTAHYGTLFDSTMVANVIETNPAEAAELVSVPMLLSVAVFGILPAIAVLRTSLPRRPLPAAALRRGLGFVAAVALVAVPLCLDQKTVFSVVRNHRELAHMIAPLDVIAGSWSYLEDRFETVPEFQPVALDAALASDAVEPDRPNVHVIVLGETARAGNFSLNGYFRDTNPSLETLPVFNFRDVSSCGTATAQSLPCMFSIQTMEEFDRERSKHQDNLLDIAARAGYDVQWIDNGNSCKGVCDRVPSRDLSKSDIVDCTADQCHDDVLVGELRRLLPGIHRDTLIVLHQLGSHGPAYYRRYPDAFRKFVPDCRSPDLANCTTQEIANAYDNTILYTDHVIAEAIEALADNADRLEVSLLYVSDHGESLGEHNIYLHGMPRRFAPEEQTHVPMVAWFSSSSVKEQGLSRDCRGEVSDRPASHDSFFHTEIGLLGIRTNVYDPFLDVFSVCRDELHAGRTDDASSVRS